MSGPPAMPEIRRSDPDPIAQPQRETALTQRVEQLEAIVADLRQALDDVRAALASVASRDEA